MKPALAIALILLSVLSGCSQKSVLAAGGAPATSSTPATPVVLSPLSYGSLCNGTGDDAVGINNAINVIRQEPTQIGVVQLPAAQCTLLTSINATGLTSASVSIIGTGGSLLCETNGTPCIDATNSSQLTIRDISITSTKTNMPNIGLQVARPSTSGTAADMYMDHITMQGYFSLACFFNLNAETQLINKLNVQNQQPGAYGAIWDGYNYFNLQSAFNPITEPVNTLNSFGDNTCVSCRITSNAAGAIPMWVGGTIGQTFVNSYVSNFATGNAVVIYNTLTNFHFDAHVEAAGLTSTFLLTGNVHPVIYGMIYREHDFFPTVSMFALDTGVVRATLEEADLNIGRIQSANGQWFDNPANYQVSGKISGVYSQGWVTPGNGFSGTTCFQTTCTTH